MRLSKEAKENMKQIQALENKYDLAPFRMAMIQLLEMGRDNFDDDSIAEWFEQIQKAEDKEKASGERSFITPDFKRHILQCAIELSKFSPLTLFAYIKKHYVINI